MDYELIDIFLGVIIFVLLIALVFLIKNPPHKELTSEIVLMKKQARKQGWYK